MPSAADLERIAAETYTDRRIRSSVYCGRCGYNLRHLPYIYQCPECGQEYNARPLSMKGIFSPHDVYFPAFDVAILVLLGPLAFSFIYGGVGNGSRTMVFFGIGIGAVALYSAVQGSFRLTKFLRLSAVARRIARAEAEED